MAKATRRLSTATPARAPRRERNPHRIADRRAVTPKQRQSIATNRPYAEVLADYKGRATIGAVTCPAGVHPDAFALKVRGGCLAPTVPDGSWIIVEPTLPGEGDLAVFWLKDDPDRPLIKRLSRSLLGYPHHPESEVVCLLEVEQANPPERFAFRMDKVKAIARVHSVVEN